MGRNVDCMCFMTWVDGGLVTKTSVLICGTETMTVHQRPFAEFPQATVVYFVSAEC